MPDLDRRTVLACLAALPAGVLARPPASPAPPLPPLPPLMLAQDAPAGVDPSGHLVSEKYDGVRAFWDGRRLRFRSGREVAAPPWFVERLPPLPLDGELWLGRGSFEALSAAVRRRQPLDAEWRPLRYLLFDLPGAGGAFASRAAAIERLARELAWPPLQAVRQTEVADRAALQRRLDAVVAAGGEGLVLHRADAHHVPGRSAALIKLKPLLDAEAVVVGAVGGRGRHQGRLGALRVRTEAGIEFLLGTGFSDADRERPPPPGAVVSFSYRGTTAAGVPRFASFLRRRDDD
jgi:DNA ligase-1